MITRKVTCDKCQKELTTDGQGVYTLSYGSIAGEGIAGDNRIPRDAHFCKGCFSQYLVPIITK